MPVILVIAGLGAIVGYSLSSSPASNLSNIEGLLVGAVIGVGAAAVYFAVKKV